MSDQSAGTRSVGDGVTKATFSSPDDLVAAVVFDGDAVLGPGEVDPPEVAIPVDDLVLQRWNW